MNGLLRADVLSAIYPLSRSRRYELITAGEFPPPVKLGARAAAWYEAEVDAVVRARALGVPQSTIRLLVADMVAVRGRKDSAALREAAVVRYLGGRA